MAKIQMNPMTSWTRLQSKVFQAAQCQHPTGRWSNMATMVCKVKVQYNLFFHYAQMYHENMNLKGNIEFSVTDMINLIQI